MSDPYILYRVKEASKKYNALPNFNKLCEDHAELIENFLLHFYKSNEVKQC